MYKYGNKDHTVILSEDGMCIPAKDGNRHYQDVLKWVADGNQIEPYVEPAPPKVTTVTPRQAKLALYGAGLLDTVESAIAAADKPTQITWVEAIEFRRDDPLINGLGKQLGLTDEQIDQLFTTAATL